MVDAAIAVALFVPFAVSDQWAFRCQRVGRGILLLAKDSSAAHLDLFSSLMPTRFVATVWLARLLWISTAVFAWRAWGWPGLGGVLLYRFVLGAFIDSISPWPSYGHLLQLIRGRIESGAAGFEGILLLSYVKEIERQMAEGANFENITVGTWFSRANQLAQKRNGDDQGY